MSIVYKSEVNRGRHWQAIFAEQMPDMPFHLWPETGDPASVEYLVAWEPPENFVTLFPNLKVVFSVGAGIDQFDTRAFPAHVKLVRMLDPNITQGIVEYTTMSVLMLHRKMPDYLKQQQQKQWAYQPWVPAPKRTVGVMGLGNLGNAVAQQLRSLNFVVRGWSRTAKELEGIDCFAGQNGLPAFLSDVDILLCMLPLTEETQGILSTDLFAMLPKGAMLVNVGRGKHLVESDLLQALDSGQLSAAMLDVLQVEPAEASHPFWVNPNIILTPHIAAVTSAEDGGRLLLANLRRHLAGQPMEGEVNLSVGY